MIQTSHETKALLSANYSSKYRRRLDEEKQLQILLITSLYS